MGKTWSNLLLHSKTKSQLEAFLSDPSHALLLSGPEGSGKYTLALATAARLLGVDDLGKYPYFSHLAKPKDKQEISIDEVRKLAVSLKLKTPGVKKLERVVLIENAETLSREAQNALLKTLEEPYSFTVFILTAPSSGSLLPTIASRVQRIDVLPADLKAAISYYSKEFEEASIKSNWQLSQGRVGVLSELLEQGEEHPLKVVVNEAKDFLRMSRYERLIKLTSYDQSQLSIFLEAMSRILSALHRNAVANGQDGDVRKLLAARKAVEQARNSLAVNASARLVALKLALNLKI